MRPGRALYGTLPGQGRSSAGPPGVSPKPGPRSPEIDKIKQTKNFKCMKIIIAILIPAPPLARSQAMCLAPAFCPCSGLGGWEEQAEILAAAMAS